MEKEIHPLRHTASHLLAAAIKNIYPNVRLGTSHDNGTEFAYDFDFATPIKTEDFEKIEAEMERLLKLKPKMICLDKTRAEARKILDKDSEIYKLELLAGIPRGDKITFYQLDNFLDLCAGPHIEDVSKIKAFKLTKITGAYWRADESNKMLTRIYGVAFEKASMLEDYNKMQEDIKRRDHNRLGRELGIFTTVDCIGQGLPLFPHNGAKVMQILERFVEDEQERRGYELTVTPRFAKKDLYEISGHWSHYKDNMYIIGNEVMDENVYALRPMTCPFQFFIYKQGVKSYRDLPCKYYETANLFRKEKSGEMHGLIRVAEFRLTDSHIVCRENQVEQVFGDVLDAFMFYMRALGLEEDVSYRLSKGDITNKKNYVDNDKAWLSSEEKIRTVMKKRKMKFVEADDEAAYYGPKIDIQIKNVHGKEDTLLTVQLDFALAEKFDLTYVDENGEKVRPFIVHHSVIGCLERIMALLIEKFAGALPVWLSATQVAIMGITSAHDEYINDVFKQMQNAGIRIKKDIRNEKVGYKIREHTMAKIPYILVAGGKEMEGGLVSVRTREGVDMGQMLVSDFIELVQKTCKEYK